MSLSDPEGYIDSSDYPPLPLNSFLECTYNVTVYTGYGVELQVTAGRRPAAPASSGRKCVKDCLRQADWFGSPSALTRAM